MRTLPAYNRYFSLAGHWLAKLPARHDGPGRDSCHASDGHPACVDSPVSDTVNARTGHPVDIPAPFAMAAPVCAQACFIYYWPVGYTHYIRVGGQRNPVCPDSAGSRRFLQTV